MEERPKKWIARIAESAALLALSAFLVRLAACWLAEIWPALLIAGVLGIAAAAVFRLWRNKDSW